MNEPTEEEIKEIKQFTEQVLFLEGLRDYKSEMWSCANEGLFIKETKTIAYGWCGVEEKTESLFLHELAHAILHDKGIGFWTSYYHKKDWYYQYDRLCQKYLGLLACYYPLFTTAIDEEELFSQII